MKNLMKSTFDKFGLILLLMMVSISAKAQEAVSGGQYTMSIATASATANTIDFNLTVTVTNPSEGMRFGGFQTSINFNTNIINGGTISLSYVGGRSTQLSGLANNAILVTSAGNVRLQVSSLSASNGVDMAQGTTYSLGTYRISNTANWATGNANMWLQDVLRTLTTRSAILGFPIGSTSGGSFNYTTITPASPPGLILSHTSALPYSLPVGQICATVASQTASTPVTCFGGSNGSSTITMSPTPTVGSITYTVDGGSSQNATLVSGAFTVSNLTAGAHEIIISNTGCSNVTASSVSVGGPSQLTNSITETACDTFTWAVNEQTYTTSGTYTGTTTNGSGCTVNETLILTINTSSVYYADTDGDGYGNASSTTNACSQPAGYVTDNTDCDDTRDTAYPGAPELSNSLDDDCDGTIDEGLTPASPGVSNQTVCKGSSSVILTATFFPGYTLRWYAAATGGTALTATPVVATSAVGPKSFWVSQRLGTTGPESLRAEITVTVVALPTEGLGNITSNTAGTTAGSYLAATTAVGQFVGTSTPVSYRIPPFTDTTLTYYWKVPTGVSIVSQTDNVLTVNFLNVSTAIGAVGSITVQAENGNGCRTAAKSVALTKALPTAPALTMNNGVDNTAITGFAKYMGTPTVLRLSAVAAATATNGYLWELPQGVNRMTALEGGSITTDLTSTDPFIFVNFAGVTLENTHTNATVTTTLTKVLRIGVKSVNAIGVSTTSNIKLTNPTTPSTASLLTLTAIAPAAPTALALNNGANATSITVISNLIGQGGTYRLSATVPATTIANRFTWELPACVTRVTDLGGLTSDNTSTSTNPEIFVRFNGSENPVAGSIYFGVKAVNDIGPSYTNNQASTVIPATSSTAKLLKLVTAVPAAPTALALNNGANATAITVISNLIGQGGTYRLSATVPATTLANSFTWELPACVTRVTDLGGLTSDNTSTSTNPEIFVKFNGINPDAGSVYFGVKAVNGVGPSYTNNQASTVIPATSSTAKLLKLVTAVPAVPGAITTTRANVCSIAGTNATAIYSVAPVALALANGYTWTVPQGALIVGTATGNSIAVSYAGDFTAGNVTVKASNGVGASLTSATLAVARTSGAVAPAALVGPVAGLCSGTSYNYSFAAGANAQTYTITGPVGSVVTSADNASNTSNVITTSNLAFTVLYSTAIVNISIVANNPCGSAAAKLFVVSKAMGAITTISGPTAVDTCSEYTYTATAVVGAVAYTWTIPSGAQIVSGQGTNTLVVTFLGTLATGSVLRVLATNACGLSSALKSTSVLTRIACPTAREEIVEVTKTPFSVKAYPNPYTETFNLSLSTSSEDKVSIVVYDMTGRLIERREVRPSDMVEQKIGDRQPSGVYNVVVTQGEEVKTLRVIKR
jgi:hypothetical protein